MPHLSRQVFAHRLDAMQALIENHELDALAFLTPDYFFYASNFEVDVLVWERPIIAIIPGDGQPFCILHALSENHARMSKDRGTLWIDDLTFYDEIPRANGRPLITELPAALDDLLRSHGLAGATIGVDSLATASSLFSARVSGVRLVDMAQELRTLRFVKTGEELELARLAASFSDWAQQQFRESIGEGVLLDELDWSIGAKMMREAGTRFLGESIKVRIFSLAGPQAAAPHGAGASGGMRMTTGDVLVNVIIVRLNGVTIENERTWLLGPPNELAANAFTAALDAQRAAIDKARAGAAVNEIDMAARAIFTERGYEKYMCHRAGHGMGIGHGGGITAHDFPHDMAFETRPLLHRELFSVEPGIYLPGVGGFRHDDSVIIGDEPEVITHAPKELDAQIVRP
jgi:Xaa-Pro aminopeptidase